MNRIFALFVALLVVGASAMRAQVIYNSASTAAEGAANGARQRDPGPGTEELSATPRRRSTTKTPTPRRSTTASSRSTRSGKRRTSTASVSSRSSPTFRNSANSICPGTASQSLTPEEFDRASGTINWPRVLEQKQYDQYRTVLDKLMKQRAYNGALTSDEYMEATAANKDWRAMLAKQKGVYPENILSQMIRFILKVNREINDNLG